MGKGSKPVGPWMSWVYDCCCRGREREKERDEDEDETVDMRSSGMRIEAL
jgi:hypothetical protein